jgi:asparagine synthetase B (glutamine-hydrolysing)
VLGDVKTFTAGFPSNDETHLAKLTSKQYYEVKYDKIENLKETIYHLEDLRVGDSWSNYGLYKLASNHVKVLFDGAGADELFGGYSWRYKGDYYKQINRTNRRSN